MGAGIQPKKAIKKLISIASVGIICCKLYVSSALKKAINTAA